MEKQTKGNKTSDIINRFAKKGIFPHQFAFTLLIPLRNIFLSPKKLIQRLELKEDSIVLEVGPDPGYFSPKVAQCVPKGKLFLVDIQQKMLDIAKKRLSRKGITNVEYYLCNGETFPFPNCTFDVIFLVTVLGEIENKEQYIKEFYRIMKPNGILSISEQAGDPDKLSKEEIKDLLKYSSFEYYKSYGNNYNYTINFKKM